ncbi:hypothetical protein ABB08_23805 [Paenibacillus larvae]|nr:hypothetical protein [Paenibacillus larvae]
MIVSIHFEKKAQVKQEQDKQEKYIEAVWQYECTDKLKTNYRKQDPTDRVPEFVPPLLHCLFPPTPLLIFSVTLIKKRLIASL